MHRKPAEEPGREHRGSTSGLQRREVLAAEREPDGDAGDRVEAQRGSVSAPTSTCGRRRLAGRWRRAVNHEPTTA
ncbi:dehydrogenase [Cellulomonas flavigena DSM 20109]|uniref:Dehydrogenase n=1 Tax=Cellulomonas flavigena (strain ATCC 482 / DSM 20109 / BCRC 11376 / JCM 18109 / NBRC 3775 / NCIMB 8073 / NRS 134) TaxID=446466 RepID=D5UI45_CELFN|nr:hypothetical protein [Cellulomonas flavigena]ADG75390.1 dehydrogenase [Cellulomonas flavigena DSM 20109]